MQVTDGCWNKKKRVQLRNEFESYCPFFVVVSRWLKSKGNRGGGGKEKEVGPRDGGGEGEEHGLCGCRSMPLTSCPVRSIEVN